VSEERSGVPPVEPDVPAPGAGAEPIPVDAPSRPDRGWLALVIALAAVALAGLGWWRTSADLTEMRTRYQALADEVAGMRRTPVMDLTGVPVRGSSNAVVTLIEFSDYECPFCLRHFQQTMPEIEKDYIATGKVLYAFRDWPVDDLHPQAIRAHVAAHCAGEQGKYWDMHDRLFANQRALGLPSLKQAAAGLGLDAAKFDQCLDSGKYAAGIAEDMKQGESLGVQSTPTVYVNGRPVVGAQPYEFFQMVIDEELAKK
jgi:protein-disulfide isomerase